ncbi:hypothetical protein [Nostoc sp. FACHB-892]
MNQISFDEIDVLLQQLASTAQESLHMAQPNLYYRFNQPLTCKSGQN